MYALLESSEVHFSPKMPVTGAGSGLISLTSVLSLQKVPRQTHNAWQYMQPTMLDQKLVLTTYVSTVMTVMDLPVPVPKHNTGLTTSDL